MYDSSIKIGFKTGPNGFFFMSVQSNGLNDLFWHLAHS